MTPFDERFADRVREVFDTYDEAVDEAALARMQAALAHPSAAPVAPDRPPVPNRPSRRWRAVGLAALGALVLVLGATLWSTQTDPAAPDLAYGAIAEATPEASGETGNTSGDLAQDSSAQDSSAGALAAPPLASGSPASPVAGAPPATVPRRAAPARPAPSRPAPRRDSPPLPPDLAPEAPVATTDLADSTDASGADTPDAEIASVDTPDPAPEARPSVDPAPPLAEGRPVIVREDDAPRPEIAILPAPEAGPGLSLTVASASTVSDGRLTSGAGIAAGVTREFEVGRGLSVATGGAIAYNRFVLGPGALTATDALTALDLDPTVDVNVTSRSEVETLALELPLDLRLGVARLGRGRVDVGVGVTSAVYVAQSFQDQGDTYSGEVVTDPRTADDRVVVDAMSFSETETVDPLGRIDLARQLNLSLGYASGSRPLAVDVYARLPLRGVTSRDLPLTTLGVRLRIALR